MNIAASNASFSSAPRAKLRIMVVDDSAVVRSILSRWIEQDPGMELAAALRNGREAVEQLQRIDPDVVVLDVEMPELDGISALPRLLEKKRDLVVIMASATTRKQAEVSLKALSLGAADCIAKPDSNVFNGTEKFRRELIDTVRELGHSKRRMIELRARRAAQAPLRASDTGGGVFGPDRLQVGTFGSVARGGAAHSFDLRPFSTAIPRILVVGASTGGPHALMTVLSLLENVSQIAPVLITQHMPPTFTAILAEHLTQAAGVPVHEAIDGEPVRVGKIYVAPGGRHMRVARRDDVVVIALDDGAPINFCKPAVDALFSSAAEVWGNWVLGAILTGMGCDGTSGAAEIAAHGGSVIAQDEDSSVIWGMPGSAVEKGLCSAVLPLKLIAPKIVRMFAGDRP